jgi:hypothetical protein
VLPLAKRGHVADLSQEPAGAGLPARVGIDLGVEHHDPDRLAGGQEPRQILEPDVEHRAVPAEGDDRRAHLEFVLTELTPFEMCELRLVRGRIVVIRQLELRPPHGNETIGHLPHVRLEDPDGNRRSILEEVIDPGERIRIVGIGAGPH